MPESWIVIGALAAGTFAIRLGGFLLGARLPTHGRWAAGFNALPGCLIIALLSVLLIEGGRTEWIGAAAALAAAAATRSLPVAMLAGIGAVWALRAGLV